MDERERFEKWFQETHGQRPSVNLETVELQIADLQTRAERARDWDVRHESALLAWNERRHLKS